MLNLFDITVVAKDVVRIAEYIPVTLGLAFSSGLLGLLLGFVLAVIRIKKIPVLNQVVGVFISFMRGTPILVQLYITYFGIPILLKYINYYQGTNFKVAGIPSVVYAIVALALNSAAFSSVILQTSFEAINQGEIDAAAALGMTGAQRMIRIIIPEAVELALPNIGNQWITLVKGTSLAFTCSVIEMTAEGKILGASGYRYFEAYVALALLYWVITIVLEQIIRIVMNHVRVPDVIDGTEGQSPGNARRRRKAYRTAGGEAL